MTPLNILISSFIIALSGAMMPGPLLTYVINASLKKGFIAGPLIIVGHSILELILIILLLSGLNELFSNQLFLSGTGIIGGSILLWMGADMVKSVIKKEVSIEEQINKKRKISGLIIPGAIVSISNPYWILWWATIGMTYLANSYQFGLFRGTGIFYIGHISADFAWYMIVAGIIAFGTKFINDRIYRTLIIIFGLILIYFAVTFIYDGITHFV